MGASHSTNVNNNNHPHSRNASNHLSNSSRHSGTSDRLSVSNLRSQLTTIYRNHEEEEDEEDEEGGGGGKEKGAEEEARRFALVRDFDLSGLKCIRVPRRNYIQMDPHKKVRFLFNRLMRNDQKPCGYSRMDLSFRFFCLVSPDSKLKSRIDFWTS